MNGFIRLIGALSRVPRGSESGGLQTPLEPGVRRDEREEKGPLLLNQGRVHVFENENVTERQNTEG